MPAPTTTHTNRSEPARLQTLVGLSLAAGIFGLWLASHIYGVFFFPLEGWNWLAAPFLIALQSWCFVGLFIIAHDAMHGSLAPGRPLLNDRIGTVLLFLYAGFAYGKLRGAHFDHHKHSGTPGDPDFDADHPRSAARWYVTFFKRYFGWLSVLYVSTAVTSYVVLLGASLWNVTVFYGIPAILSSVQLFYFGTYRPHRHEDDRFADRHNARSLDYSWLASLASCFHFGYHREHHIAPKTPWWGLPALRRDRDEQPRRTI